MDDIEKAEQENSIGPMALYSPLQLAVGALLGGPLAAIYFLRSNYIALGNHEKVKIVVAWGIPIYIAIIVSGMYLPSDLFPDYMIGFLTAGLVYQIAKQTMPVKKEIQSNEGLSFQSKWRVFLMGGLLAIVHTCVVIALAYFISLFG